MWGFHKQTVSFDLFFIFSLYQIRLVGKRAVGAFFGGQSSVVSRDAVGNTTLVLLLLQLLKRIGARPVYVRHSPHTNAATSSAV